MKSNRKPWSGLLLIFHFSPILNELVKLPPVHLKAGRLKHLGQSGIRSKGCSTGVFCDTQQQMERYVALYNGDMQAALNAVNTEVNDPTACMYGTIAYIRGPEIATARNNEAYHIVRVIVVGFMTHSGFRASAPAASFSAEKIDERVA